MYHAIASAQVLARDPRYTLTESALDEHLLRIHREAGGACCARDWLKGIRRESVMLTFDDGKASDYEVALPLLLKHGMNADFFINPATVGSPGFVSWQALREMSEAGMSIQSHGYDHVYLTSLNSTALRKNLYSSRVSIEDRLGTPVTLLAPPGGRMPPHLAAIARELGYTHVMCSKPGLVTAMEGSTPLPRLAITSTLSDLTFGRWIAGNAAAIASARLRYGILAFAKRTMGDARYERLRANALSGSDSSRREA